jgi:hypothetical protein
MVTSSKKQRLTPEAFTEWLAAALGASLRSVVLYGSSAAGDRVDGGSDHNLLVVLDRLDAEALSRVAPLMRQWAAAGQPPPRLFTPQSLRRSADVFGLEIADLKDARKILHGEDPIAALAVDPAHLRFELEFELHGTLQRLRAAYALSVGRPKDVQRLMIQSLSTVLVLARGALRLYEPSAPPKKLDALRALARHVPIRVEPFERIAAWKAGERAADPEEVFAEYLTELERLAEAIDAHLHGGGT